jgi:uncharacterized protein YjbI with pentapeptide repeats
MEDSALLYIASTYGFIRSRLFTNKNNRRLKRDILSEANVSVSEANVSVSEANISDEANISEANTNALNSQEAEKFIREIIYEVISEAMKASLSEASLSEAYLSEAMKASLSEASLSEASLSEANLSEAMKANVSEAMKASLSESSLSESINIDDSWYRFDNLKIYHCHIPIVSNELSDSGDDF